MLKRSKLIGYGIGWVLSTAALAYMVYRLVIYEDYDALVQSFQSVSLQQYLCLGLAVVLLPVQLLIESRKWQLLMQGLTTITLRQSWVQVLRGYVGAFITPYRLGEYPTRLLQMGYSWSQWRHHLGSWRDWLLNGRKWLSIGGWHLARYIVWMTQLGSVLLFVGVQIPLGQAILAIVEYYVLITIAPCIPSVEVACKGGWAVLVFSQYTTQLPAVAIAVVLIWGINTLLPTLVGVWLRPALPNQNESIIQTTNI